MLSPLSFELQPSRQQRRLDGFFIGLSWLLLWPLLSWFWLLFGLLLTLLVFAWVHRRSVQIVVHLRWHSGCWWLQGNTTRALPWRVGSVRRRNLIVWRYGFWPWQCLLIRPDSLPAGQFQQLLRELALRPL